jgi:cytochrome c oxidase cbb3-type subunit 4
MDYLINNASSIMTAVSFTTFVGILLWTFVIKGKKDFDSAAALPFADGEDHHG